MTDPLAAPHQPLDPLAEVAAEAARRDSFVALLAHEIRNPLAPIRSGVALLRSGRLDERAQADTLTMMERQLAHLVRLVDDLLASVSVRGGEVLVTAEPVNLADVLAAAIEGVRPSILAKQQVLDVAGFDLAAVVEVDPKRLAQAFSNLLNMSSKKTPWNGRLSVEMTLHGNVAVIGFTDTGITVPKAELGDVFELFAQSSISIGEGLGIGLSLVRGLVEMNGGTVDAMEAPTPLAGEGEPATGTVFVVKLPVRHIEAGLQPRIAPTAAVAAPWHSRRVLVVDDNRDAAQTLGALLELDGHTIRLAHDGPAAVAEAREFSPEVILMDIGLPGFNGLVATREIRRLAFSKRPTIVALTGWGSAADRESTQAAGCDLHLVKPIDYREIARTLALAPHSAKEST